MDATASPARRRPGAWRSVLRGLAMLRLIGTSWWDRTTSCASTTIQSGTRLARHLASVLSRVLVLLVTRSPLPTEFVFQFRATSRTVRALTPQQMLAGSALAGSVRIAMVDSDFANQVAARYPQVQPNVLPDAEGHTDFSVLFVPST